MNIQPNQVSILSAGANMIFGEPTSISGNYLLDATLRYYTLKYSGLPLDKLDGRATIEFMRADNDDELRLAFGSDRRPFVVVRSTSYVMSDDFTPPEGWTTLNTPPYNVSAFLTQCVGKGKADRPARSLVYIHEAERRVVVYTNGLTSVWLDALAAILPRILRWYFPTSDMPAEDHALSKTIFDPSSGDDASKIANFASIINSLVSKYDFESVRLNKIFDGYGNRIRDQRILSLRKNVEESYENIRRYRETLSEIYARLEEQEAELRAFSLLSDSSSDEILDFFKKHKNIFVHRIEGSDIYYSVVDTIEYYDEEEFEKVYENPRSYAGSNNAPNWVREVLYAIFKEHRAVLKSEARFKLTALRSLRADGSAEYNPDAFPHPHLVEYHCLGANEMEIDKCLEVGDWMMAVEQSIAATKNIAFKDTTVCTKFVKNIDNYSSKRCVILPDQTAMTISEFRKMLENEKKAQKAAAKKTEGASANG